MVPLGAALSTDGYSWVVELVGVEVQHEEETKEVMEAVQILGGSLMIEKRVRPSWCCRLRSSPCHET